jgi:NAD(P)H-hydrate epimerase
MVEEASSVTFRTAAGRAVPAVTADQMRDVDQVAVGPFGLGLLQMMENAGRSLAENAIDMLAGDRGEIAVLAGSGGNGGGGLCCARHLQNHGFSVSLLLSKDAEELTGAAAHQLRTLRAAGLEPTAHGRVREVIRRSALVVDALIGYSLRGAPRGRAAELIVRCNREARRVLSLDIPSGRDATTGEAPGDVVEPQRTLTLALPKRGLRDVRGELYLADIGIPPGVYGRLGFFFEWPMPWRYWIPLER